MKKYQQYIDLYMLSCLHRSFRNKRIFVWASTGKIFDRLNIDTYSICGSNEEGILIEESLLLFLEQSDITIIFYCKDEKEYAMFTQNNKDYYCPIIYNKAGCSINDRHFDFNQLTKIN